MKKSKLLMPLVGVAALGATVAAPIATLTSCSQDSVESISAKYTLGTNTFVHATINKSDIVVTATMKSGKTQEIKDWTCDKFTSETYIVAEDDVTEGKLTLTIKYKEKETSIVLEIEELTKLTFDYPCVQLTKGENFSTQKIFNLYTYGGLNPQRISPKKLVFKTDVENTVSVKCVDESKDIWTIGVSDQYTGETQKVVLGVYNSDTDPNPMAETTVLIGGKDILAVQTSDTEASIAIGEANNIIVDSETYENVFITPDYVKSGDKILPVTAYLESTEQAPVTAIQSLIISDAITYIPGNLFHTTDGSKIALSEILYLGTSDNWEWVEKGANWQGELATHVYCFGDNKSVQLANRIDTISKEGKIVSASTFRGRTTAPRTIYVRWDGEIVAKGAKAVEITESGYIPWAGGPSFIHFYVIDLKGIVKIIDGLELEYSRTESKYSLSTENLAKFNKLLTDNNASTVVFEINAPRNSNEFNLEITPNS